MFVKNWTKGWTFLLLMITLTIFGAITGFAEINPMETQKTIEVELNDDYFNPKSITIPSKTATTLVLKNKGKKEHTFTVSKLGIDVELQPGVERIITVPPQKRGTYELVCRYHIKEGMVGEVVVE